jgi:hypothetical protein
VSFIAPSGRKVDFQAADGNRAKIKRQAALAASFPMEIAAGL